MGLRLCHSSKLRSPGVDLKYTATVYNLCFWINKDHSYIHLATEPYSIVELWYNGNYRLYSEECSYEDELVKKLEFTIGLKEDISEFIEKGVHDPLLGPFLENYRGLRIRSTNLWWAIVTSISQQNASFKQGWSTLHRIIESYNRTIELGEGIIVPRPPTPREVLEDIDRLINAGVGYRAKTILNTARTLLNGEIREEDIINMKSIEIERTLRKIKGIGPYTARLAIALSTRRYELPPVDKWLKKIASIVYSIDENLVEKYWTERWNKWAALAAIATTIALDAEPLNRALVRIRNHQLLPVLNQTPTPLNMIGFCFKQY